MSKTRPGVPERKVNNYEIPNKKVSFLGAAAAFSLEERALPSSSANDAKAAQSFFIKKRSKYTIPAQTGL